MADLVLLLVEKGEAGCNIAGHQVCVLSGKAQQTAVRAIGLPGKPSIQLNTARRQTCKCPGTLLRQRKLLLLSETVLCSLSWPSAHDIVKHDLKFQIFLPPPPKYKNIVYGG